MGVDVDVELDLDVEYKANGQMIKSLKQSTNSPYQPCSAHFPFLPCPPTPTPTPMPTPTPTLKLMPTPSLPKSLPKT